MSLKLDFAHSAGTSGLTLYYSVERASDGYYWDTTTNTFRAKGDISGTNDHISLTEDTDEDGRYLDTLATTVVAQWVDGNYSCIIRNASGDVLLGIHKKYMKDQEEVFFRLNEI